MTPGASVPTPIGSGVGKRRCLPKPRVDATMQVAQGASIMEKQPHSRMCLLCGIDKPIGLKLKLYTDDSGRRVARFRPRPEH
jgi:hypothetical protein